MILVMKLGTIISHPTLGKKVYVNYIDGEANVNLVDQQLTDVTGYGEERYRCYTHNLESGIISDNGWASSPYGRMKDLVGDEPQAEPLTILFVARLLDESVDSKQIIQALNSEGIPLNGVSLFKNYLGMWKIRNSDGAEMSLMTFIAKLDKFQTSRSA